jgi:hypothetical protein
VHLENLPLAAPWQIPDIRLNDFRSAAILAIDLTCDMKHDERRNLIASVIEALGKYITEVDDNQSLSARYRAGDLKSAFIRKDVKRLLASD